MDSSSVLHRTTRAFASAEDDAMTLYAIALFGSGAFRLLGGSHEIPNFIPYATKGQRIKA